MNHTRLLTLPLMAALIALSIPTRTVHAAESTAAAPTDVASETELAPPTKDAQRAPVAVPASLAGFCFFANLPPADQKYTVVKNLKIGKGTYGSVTDILPKMAEYAQVHGADAIIQYTGSQRFGFWPWRIVRPVVRGVAVQWAEPKPADCESIGGTKLSTILSSGLPPAK